MREGWDYGEQQCNAAEVTSALQCVFTSRGAAMQSGRASTVHKMIGLNEKKKFPPLYNEEMHLVELKKRTMRLLTN